MLMQSQISTQCNAATDRLLMDDEHAYLRSREQRIERLVENIESQHAEILKLTCENARLTARCERFEAENATLRKERDFLRTVDDAAESHIRETIAAAGDVGEVEVPFEPREALIPEVVVGFVTWRQEALDFGRKVALYRAE